MASWLRFAVSRPPPYHRDYLPPCPLVHVAQPAAARQWCHRPRGPSAPLGARIAFLRCRRAGSSLQRGVLALPPVVPPRLQVLRSRFALRLCFRHLAHFSSSPPVFLLRLPWFPLPSLLPLCLPFRALSLQAFSPLARQRALPCAHQSARSCFPFSRACASMLPGVAQVSDSSAAPSLSAGRVLVISPQMPLSVPPPMARLVSVRNTGLSIKTPCLYLDWSVLLGAHALHPSVGRSFSAICWL